jgi:hypothetical protein
MTIAPELSVALATVEDLADLADVQARWLESHGVQSNGLREEAAALRVVAAAARAGQALRQDVSHAVGAR